VADHEPGIQKPETRCGHDKEVHRRDLVSVIPKERVPSLALKTVGIPFREVSSDRGTADEDSELLEFGLNLTSAPVVLVGESPNECSHLGRNQGPTRSGLGDRAPVELLGSFASSPLRCRRATVSGWTMTRTSFHPDQVRGSKIRKPRSAGVMRGRRPFSPKVASCWRRASSTIACRLRLRLRLRKNAGTHRKMIVTRFSSCRMARHIVQRASREYEAESSLATGLPSLVDRSSAGPEKHNDSGPDQPWERKIYDHRTVVTYPAFRRFAAGLVFFAVFLAVAGFRFRSFFQSGDFSASL